MNAPSVSGRLMLAIAAALSAIGFACLFLLVHRPRPLEMQAYMGPYRLEDYKVSMERTPCFGYCPAFEMTIHSNGDATLETPARDPNAPYAVEGRSLLLERKIARETKLDIVASLERGRFRSLAYDYSVEATDLPGTKIEVESPRGNWSVRVYGVPCERDAAESLWEIPGQGAKKPVPDVFCDLAEKLDRVACDAYENGRRTYAGSERLQAVFPPKCEIPL